MDVSSSAFTDVGAIPAHYTCDGAGLSPPLAWSDLPSGTSAIAIIVTDPDAHGFVHWLATDIPPGKVEGGLPEGASGSAAAGAEGRNGFGTAGYGAPCPPSGEHRYVWEVFALSASTGMEPGFGEAELRGRIAPVTLARGVLTGRCRRDG